MDYQEIFRSMYNQLINAGQTQTEAYRIAKEQADATARILIDKGEMKPELR